MPASLITNGALSHPSVNGALISAFNVMKRPTIEVDLARLDARSSIHLLETSHVAT